MLCAKREYDRDVIINKCLRFYDLKATKDTTFLWTLVQNSSFLWRNASLELCLNLQSLYMHMFL